MSYGPRSCANTCPSPFGLQPPTYLSLVSFERRHFLKRCESFSFHTPMCRACFVRASTSLPTILTFPSSLLLYLVFFPLTVHYTHPLHNNKRRLYTDFVLYACWHVHRKHLSGSLFLNISVFKTFRKSLGDGLGKDCWPLTKHCENYIQCNHIACSKERPIFFLSENKCSL